MSITNASEHIPLICTICVRKKIKETDLSDLSEKITDLIYWFNLLVLIYWFNLLQIYFPHPPRKRNPFLIQKSPCKSIDLQGAISVSLYPERGSNPHAFQHRCLRPTCLPIPTSGRKAVAKVIVFFGFCKLISKNFADRYKISNSALIKKVESSK